ncbi:MAG: GNAT family N-acetyltransferase [Frankia sp.]
MELRPDYPIITERLTLRPLRASDAAALLSYRSIPEVCRWVPFEPMNAAEIATRLAGQWASTTIDDEGQHLTLGVELTATGELVGDVVLMLHSREHRSGEIGYIMHPAHAGRGYATEAVRTLLRLAFEDLGLHRVAARVDARNAQSARLATRLGMRQEAHLRSNEWFKGEWSDKLVFAMLDEEWASRRPEPLPNDPGAS